ncbi:hypothetical protein KFL_002480110 [Klebsormidium nitens]|uniref:Small ribosomal subunit protein mS23 n=1 Tax=Klebsormidium nitens TaxID=105231 RepID=A0A1Y1I598_KLENI|nr:hypothetical protein KFL_002480110 [Klebsormidium nitens]|eukprot:GAQ85673.1 hypothetical protein KFL_002480110 [Klebsormidium nitens]
MAKYLKIYKMNWQQILRNVGGLVKQGGPLYPEPVWYEPALSVAPRPEQNKFKKPPRPPQIVLPEDEHVKAFYKMFPEEQNYTTHYSYGPGATLATIPPARIFAHRVLDLLRNDYDLPTAYEIAVDEHEVRQEFGSDAAFREALERMKYGGSEDTEEVNASGYEDEEDETEYTEGDEAEVLESQREYPNDEGDYPDEEVEYPDKEFEYPDNEGDHTEGNQVAQNGARTLTTDSRQ